mmetsp:Transcript_148673/g.270589  ORF Transcript_148673/g.270589 Transcript_148673/m.270589 type:complete len:279 (+) Transcript_148673:1006-1842(+)
MWELDCELLSTGQWRALCSCQVCQPMEKVECKITRTRPVQHPFEGGEHGARRSFCLHKPAVVELQFALAEQDGPFGSVGQPSKRRQQLRIVLKQVRQGLIVIVNSRTCTMAQVRSMLWLHNRAQFLNFHDVMESCQAEHCSHCVCAAQVGHVHDLGELRPIHDMKEDLSLLLVSGLSVARGPDALEDGAPLPHHPILINTKTEAIFPINIKAEQPKDGKQGTHRALVLPHSLKPRCAGADSLGEEKLQLREGSHSIFKEFFQAVAGLSDLHRHAPDAL